MKAIVSGFECYHLTEDCQKTLCGIDVSSYGEESLHDFEFDKNSSNCLIWMGPIGVWPCKKCVGNLTPLALDGGDSAASEQLSTPEVLSILQGESTPAHRK